VSKSSWLLQLPVVGKGHSKRGAFALRQKMSYKEARIRRDSKGSTLKKRKGGAKSFAKKFNYDSF